MSSDVSLHGTLQWLLADFVQQVPHTHSAVLTSSDGVKKAVHGLDDGDADKLSAILTGLLSLGRGVGSVCGSSRPGAVRQVVVEHDSAMLYVCMAGPGSVLGVLTSHDADPGVVGYQMSQLVKSVAAHLATPPRPGALPSANPVVR